MANWDSEFDIKPKGTDLVGEMDDYIRATRQETRIRMAKEHLFDMTSPTTQGHQGLARMGSARVWWSDTEPAQPTPSTSEADNAGTSGRVWIVTSTGTPTGEIKVYSGSAWVSIGSFAPASLLTAIKTVDGSGSGLDTDLVRATTPGTGGLSLLALAALGTGWTSGLAANFTYTGGAGAATPLFSPTRMDNITGNASSPAIVGGATNLYTMRRSGTIRAIMTFAHTGGGTSYARWYKNGSAVGTLRSNGTETPATYAEDLAVVTGDVLGLKAYTDGGAESSYTFSAITLAVAEAYT